MQSLLSVKQVPWQIFHASANLNTLLLGDQGKKREIDRSLENQSAERKIKSVVNNINWVFAAARAITSYSAWKSHRWKIAHFSKARLHKNQRGVKTDTGMPCSILAVHQMVDAIPFTMAVITPVIQCQFKKQAQRISNHLWLYIIFIA